MKVTKSEEFDAFQLTEANSRSNVDWPQWMHEAWCKEDDDQYALGRMKTIRPDANELILSLRLADTWAPVHPSNWLVRNQHGHIRVVSYRVFKRDYKETN